MKFINGLNKVVEKAQFVFKLLLIGWALIESIKFFVEKVKGYLGEEGLKIFEKQVNEKMDSNSAVNDSAASNITDDDRSKKSDTTIFSIFKQKKPEGDKEQQSGESEEDEHPLEGSGTEFSID